jgi:hypothetical protein
MSGRGRFTGIMLGEAYKDILSRADVIFTSDHTFENVDEIH